MMKLSLMRDFLHSPFQEKWVISALELWEYEKGSVKFIRASSNFVYSFKRGNASFILRITPAEDKERLERELQFLDILSTNRIAVNTPILSVNSKFIEEVQTEWGTFHAVALNFIEGSHHEMEKMGDKQWIAWGKALGSIHHVSKRSGVLKDMRKMEDLLNITVPELPSAVQMEEKVLGEWLLKLQHNDDIYGPIHFDFELDNIIWQEDHPQFIDFESGVEGWFAADICFALRDLFERDSSLQSREFLLFIEGYRLICTLSDEEVLKIPMFLRLHNLIMFKQLKKSLDVVIDSGQPQWVNDLIVKLENRLRWYGEGIEAATAGKAAKEEYGRQGR
ncbi:phosphotransferase [Rossellomorea vietnamensis]|uniref:Phosphotransferase n=2 Tax=Rossellomorea TaxID=2837508 RepID=A0A5D4KDL8_9BACI|nr:MULTISPECIES: phosphotransferase [Rossellomorea]TYR74880.1 phosphotransferase [Rossellomorea vietnamensis]TYS83300.1 phosphotransferase [Rossellomorea aquimaris]